MLHPYQKCRAPEYIKEYIANTDPTGLPSEKREQDWEPHAEQDLFDHDLEDFDNLTKPRADRQELMGWE